MRRISWLPSRQYSERLGQAVRFHTPKPGAHLEHGPLAVQSASQGMPLATDQNGGEMF